MGIMRGKGVTLDRWLYAPDPCKKPCKYPVYRDHLWFEIEKDGRLYIFYQEWWGDAVAIYEGNRMVEHITDDERINRILDEIAEEVANI